jgi:hypothetical protein
MAIERPVSLATSKGNSTALKPPGRIPTTARVKYSTQELSDCFLIDEGCNYRMDLETLAIDGQGW